MAYQVYFSDLTEENQALLLTLLRLKEEAGSIEPQEAELLTQLRGSPEPLPTTPEPKPRGAYRTQRRSGGRRGAGNGRSNGAA